MSPKINIELTEYIAEELAMLQLLFTIDGQKNVTTFFEKNLST
jgi:hypothetical protein